MIQLTSRQAKDHPKNRRMHRSPSVPKVLVLIVSLVLFIIVSRICLLQALVRVDYPQAYPEAVPISMATAIRDGRTVIVVGSGLAGLAAASAALRANAKAVVLLERAAKPGGNSIKASSGINGAPTRFQHQPPLDTAFFPDTVKSAGKCISSQHTVEQDRRRRLIKILTDSSATAVDFLADEIGVDLSIVTQLGGHSVARTHRGAGKTPPGADIITRLLRVLQQDSRFQLRTSCEVIRLLTLPNGSGSSNSPTIAGVEYRSGDEVSSAAGPVVFATGGFAGDAGGLLTQHRPDLAGLPSTNEPRPGMHHLLTGVGAQLVDMDSVQIHPTGFVDPLDRASALKFLAAEMLRGEGGILLHNGRRFVNELDTRERVSHAIMHLEPSPDPLRQWNVQILLDPGACRAAASHVAFYEWKGLLSRTRVSELNERTRSTLVAYSLAARKQEPDIFGRLVFGHWELTGSLEDDDKEVCVGWVTPVTHFTMGGVAINDKGQVLSSIDGLKAGSEVPVPGLWAAGEITGGIHGDNRLGGSSLLECVVFGRIAGEQAAESIEGD